MTQKIYKQIPLYRFLDLCMEHSTNITQTTSNAPTILDCGAGGKTPPLGLFKSHGFTTCGIDLDEQAISDANAFGENLGFDLNIAKGDMTSLDFPDQTFDYVYSYNSIFHMKKDAIRASINELKRVLKPGGLMFVNFLSVDDCRCGEGPHLGDNQYEQMDDEPVIHSYYAHHEADVYFDDMKTLIKEQRIIQRIYEGNLIKQGFIDYILKK